MAATITGTVFNDLNHNGQFSSGEPGIPKPACPPTTFTQPSGFTMSNGPRKLTVAVTTTQINNNTTIANQNFSHDSLVNQNVSQADVSVIITADPMPAVTGEIFTYTIVVTNAGPSLAENVMLIDAMPSQVTNTEFSVDGGATFNPWENSYSIGSLPNGASQTVIIIGTVDASTVGTITNTAMVTSTTPDSDPTNNTSTIDTPVIPSADISIINIGSPSPVIAGQLLTYTIIATNAGPSVAENVVLTDTAPSELASVEFSVDGGVTFNPWIDSYNLGTLVNGNTVTVILQGIVTSSSVGTITTTATINSTIPDPDLFNNISTAVTPIINTVDHLVENADYPSPVTSATENITLTDVVPSGLMNAQFSIDGGADVSSIIQEPDPTDNTSTIVTPMNGATDLSIVRTTIPDSVSPEQVLPYNLVVSNEGLFAADNIVVTESVPTVSSTTPDPDPGNDRSIIVTPVNASSDLSIVNTSSSDPVFPGQLLTYSVVVSNEGPSDATDVIVTESVPSQLENVEFSIDGGVTFNPWSGTYTIGTLGNSFGLMLIFRGTVINSVSGTITNTVTVDSTTPDPDPGNNTSIIITPVSASSDLSIVKTSSSDPVVPGQLLTYSVVVSNEGPSDATDVIVTESVPSQLENVEFSIDGGVTFNPWLGSYTIGTLGNSFGLTIIFRGTVINSASDAISNTVTVSSSTQDPDPANNTSTNHTPISVYADISVVKTASPNPVSPGQLLTFTVVVSNNGPSNAENVTLIDAVSNVLSNVEFSTNEGTTFAPWGGSLSIGTLANGASITILIRGMVSSYSSGPVTNTAIVNTTTPDLNPANNTSTVTLNVSETANLSIVKFGCPDQACPGQLLTYSIVVSNAGPSNAENVTLTDIVPSLIRNVEFSMNGGLNYVPWTGTHQLGKLANGSSVAVLIRGKISSFAEGMISNTATVHASTPDPEPSNNSSTFVIHIQKCDSSKESPKHRRSIKCQKCTKSHKCDKCRRAALKRKNRSRIVLRLKLK
ncbi:DUF11 domain-containing protein [Paenibacillus sp. FSL R10-2734]|uniref:COG1361 S-layer family protein n=1 Tax=Paenibacillus sp. FSL R10-2734 TaxID=2954691 RepID=UPI0030D95849